MMPPSSNRPTPYHAYTWWLDGLLITLLVTILYFTLLGDRPLFVPDEGRYAEIAREMIARQDYITPHLNAIKYFEKPPLFYWLEVAMIKIMGLSLFSLRSVNALIATLGALFIYASGRQLYSRSTGLLAAAILSTSTLYFAMAHTISLDLPVSVFIMITLLSFLLATEVSLPQQKRLLMYVAACSAACAVLTKGLIGVVLPGLVVAAWLSATKQWRLLITLYLPSTCFVFLAIALPWHVIVHMRNPEFFNFYIIQQHVMRYTMPHVGHYQPVWYFIPIFILCYFPWIVFLPQTMVHGWKEIRSESPKRTISLFLWLWAILIFVFFSFSKSKLIPYILPVIPPVALLTAHTLIQCINTSRLKSILISNVTLLLLSIALALLYLYLPHHTTFPQPELVKKTLTFASCIIVIGYGATLYVARKHPLTSLSLLIFTTGLFYLFSLAAMPGLDKRSIRPLANRLKQISTPQDDIVAYNQYYQDLPFYLERRITVLNWKNELSFGMQHQNTKEWMINDITFWQRWHSPQRVFALMGRDDYDKFKQKYKTEKPHLIDQTLTNVLISNRP